MLLIGSFWWLRKQLPSENVSIYLLFLLLVWETFCLTITIYYKFIVTENDSVFNNYLHKNYKHYKNTNILKFSII